MKYSKQYFTNTTVKGKEVYEKYLSFLKKLNISLTNKTICDVGCATGKFIENIIDKNNCYGFDTSKFAVLQCKEKFSSIKSHFTCLNLSENRYRVSAKFDIITLFDVIEHLDNFVYLKKIFTSNLKKGGYVIVTTPNSNNVLRYFSPNNFTGEMDDTHVMLFTPYTLDFFLRKCGLKKIILSTPYSFYFKNNFLTSHVLFGGQIFAVYRKVK